MTISILLADDQPMPWLLTARQLRLQHRPLRIRQVRPAAGRYGRHEVSGSMVFLVVDSSTGDLIASRPPTRQVTTL